jgi:two-component system, OmpR family, phosphate regulon sensor histidine kinase PhoR
MYERRLAWRLFVAYLLVTLAALIGLGWYGSYVLDEALASGLSRQLQTTAQLLAQQIEPILDAADEAEIGAVATRASRTNGSRISVILPSGVVLADTHEDPQQMDNHAWRREVQAALAGEIRREDRFSNTLGEQLVYVAVPMMRRDQVVGVVRAAVSRAESRRELRHYQGLLFSGLGIATIAATLVSWRLARLQSRPFEEVAEAAQRLAQGNETERLPKSDVQELARLSESLNHLAQELEERGHTIGRQEHELEAVLASMVEGVLAVDSDERVISINRAAAGLIGGAVSEMRGRSLQEVVRNAELRRLATRAVTEGRSVEDDLVLRGEQDRVLQVCATPLRNVQGRSMGALLVLHDVTHFRHLENIRRDFVANVSHELKTPIALIKGFVETLLDGALENREDATRFLRIVAKQAERLNQIIEDLLSLAKIEESEEKGNLPLEPGSIKEILEAAMNDCQAQAAERDIRVDVLCDEDVVANINAHLLEQAVVNLLDNAIKYSDSGGEVLLAGGALSSEVLISVTDHGCGIDRDHLPRLFERFYRVDKARSRKLGGTGLGLAIVKHIVQAHGGKVSVQSTPGKGSTFTIQLPPVRTPVSQA